MNSKTREGSSGLADLLPDASFREHHSCVVDAPRERVWEALHRLRWTDLHVGRPLMALRGLHAPTAGDTVLTTFTQRAGGLLVEEPPASAWFVMVGRPWSLVPRHVDVGSVEDARAFSEPGWLRYGMDWHLHDLGDGRTLVETATLCDPTDAGARLAFCVYWGVIKWGSSAIRLDMLAALRRLTERG